MKVPSEFQPKIKVAYPPGNDEIFEQWLINNIDHPNYLPINFCGYYVNNKYGKDRISMRRLQQYIDSLPRDQKYFTVTQYDDSILNDISRLDIKVFGSGGGRIDHPIPLICKPHGRVEKKRDIFASFTGSLTHEIRGQIFRMPLGEDYYISAKHHVIKDFCDILASSVFALCPRGYGLTSFRICEALEQGSIPVYISDKFIIPDYQDFEEYGVLIDQSQINDIDRILRSITPEQIEAKREAGKRIYQELFTFEGLKSVILKNI